MKILKNSVEIAEAIRKILSNRSDERIVAVAYVGDNALSYLPDPESIRLYCSTEIPGTNPSSLRTLKTHGVLISEVSRLHSKLYWSKVGGVVICSANLSNNGLSGDGNHEVGVYLPSGHFDVPAYLSELESHPIDFSDIEKLEKKYNLYRLKNRERNRTGKAKTQDFFRWNSDAGPKWKIYPWTENGDLPRDVKSQLTNKYPGVREYDFMQSAAKNSYEIGGWVLSVKENWRADKLTSVSDLYWFIPEMRIESKQKSSKNYPYYWIMLHDKTPSPKPFNVRTDRFRRLFSDSYLELTSSEKDVTSRNNDPSEAFIALLRMKHASRQ